MVHALGRYFRRAGAGQFFLQDNLLVQGGFHPAVGFGPGRGDPAFGVQLAMPPHGTVEGRAGRPAAQVVGQGGLDPAPDVGAKGRLVGAVGAETYRHGQNLTYYAIMRQIRKKGRKDNGITGRI